ncbi:MAG: trehalose-phosphatase [Alphaproteobacteria bacterium]|nr:trehalose-phosphatase [Alphaproteobacteria bacterium]
MIYSGAIEHDLPPRAALLLDLDGTLLDLAATPDAVRVPPGLPGVLRGLRAALGDAMAIVTGRPIEAIDALLPGIAFAVAGEHGGVIRFTPGGPEERAPLPPLPAHWAEAAAALVAAHPGTLFEPKARGFTLHYRAAPQAAAALAEGLAAILGAQDTHLLLPAHMAFEVKPRGADKGTALAALMARAPFRGRVPVYVGDDVTDEDAILAAEAAGGVGLRVAEAFGDAAGVRAWLARLAHGARAA